VDCGGAALHRRDERGVGDGGHVRDVGVVAHRDHVFLFRARVADDELQQEAVELRFGQRIGALVLDRILGRHHEERLGQGEGLVADRDLALFHRFEQRRLHLRGCAVDLVGEQHRCEDRSLAHREAALVRVVDRRAHEIARQQSGVNCTRRKPRPSACASAHCRRLGETGTPSTST
jgi:hypothetical protein